MSGKVKEEILTVSEVKRILERVGEENLDQFQRRALDYASKFAKLDVKSSKKLVKNLVKEYELKEEEAVQIVNCMPGSIEELRVFLAGGRRIVETKKLEDILKVLDEFRTKE
jgi:DNA-directed RNA polymerase subunit F